MQKTVQASELKFIFTRNERSLFSRYLYCKNSANERNASLLASYNVSAAYFRGIYIAKIVQTSVTQVYLQVTKRVQPIFAVSIPQS